MHTKERNIGSKRIVGNRGQPAVLIIMNVDIAEDLFRDLANLSRSGRRIIQLKAALQKVGIARPIREVQLGETNDDDLPF